MLVELVDGLAARGHEQAVVCLGYGWEGGLVEHLKKAGVEVFLVGKAGVLGGYGLLFCWRWLRRGRFDVAVTMLFVSDVVGRAMAWAVGIPRIISSLRARNCEHSWWKRGFARGTMRWADAVVLNSKTFCDYAIAIEGVPADRLQVIPNGVHPVDLKQAERPALLREWGLIPSACVVGSVGRLSRQKGFDLLIQAVAMLGRQDLHLLLAGKGEEEEALRRLASAEGLARRVHLIGYRRDVSRLLGALDLYVQPSRYEGMPNALLEAMVARRPIVAAAVDGICDLIEDGVHGWLVPPEDVPALAQAIEKALSNPTEAQRRAAEAQRRAITHFTIGAMVSAWERVLTGIPESGHTAEGGVVQTSTRGQANKGHVLS